ncbi:RNA polymerase II transcription factor SIII subunit A-domain-containing protein [Russula vinacea]|nr:RNA polymerase II transcription factor SIII subunit A-domain-containing protein [Russula vinacea]
MSSEIDTPCRRIPSLVHYCRRVAILHVDGIVSLGDTLSFEIVRPILEFCTADNLRRLENATPHLRTHTNDLWRDLCFREFQVEAEEYSSGSLPPPKSWRDLFFVRDFWFPTRKEKRLEEISARMKTQRLEAEKRKREKEIKFTDRLPPMKRARGFYSRRPAAKPQRYRGHVRAMHATPNAKAQSNRQRIRDIVSEPPSPSKPASGTRVIVRSMKEPTCSLFMPKHRAHSQLASRLVPSRAFPTK